ncbi:hypothetical protein [Vibrio scophthalmi]|uniref:Uncharacterized protein n=1 Tax=Vibrio scophthalmi LMG 19158 TaxID=870967 RepID=F9RIZ9_9VIBR|nr:hypothetical protein [Vibrio scophthalmi]EGU41584.1 hypothetical protein VIS19158_07450 [Vibrio scophthalmi LMG 19158]
MKFYYLLFFIFISNGVHAESRIRILIDELARIHYEQHDANVVEREIENINSLSKIDEALSQSDIDGARKLVLLEMAKSAYKISEYSKNLSVKNGKNEASYTLGLFEGYISRNELFVTYPALKGLIDSSIEFPEQTGERTGMDNKRHNYFSDKFWAIQDELSE